MEALSRDRERYRYDNVCTSRSRRLRVGGIVRRNFLRVVEQDALEQLDGLFYDLVRLVSLRVAQGIGLDNTLDEMSTSLLVY